MEKRIYFRHMTTTDGRRFTVAGIYETETFDDIVIGISLCGEKENFSKNIGRTIALGRAKAGSGTRGRNLISLYETQSSENYWFGQESKVFIGKTNRFATKTAAELKDDFRLKRRTPKQVKPVK